MTCSTAASFCRTFGKVWTIAPGKLLWRRNQDELLAHLQEAQMLTAYQTAHLRSEGAGNLVLGNYRILDQIGAGGMGIVYRGEHAFLRRPVAIKVFKDPLETGQILLQRFFVEMRASSRIRHPNVVWALDAGTVKGKRPEEPHRHYLVMEFVTGSNLEQLAAKNPLGVAQACELIYQIAGALDETHKLNLIHRDIKPSNILVTAQNTAKLLDFGLALHFGQRRLTMPGTVLGTLGYMAPEQVADAAHVDIRADIFGLGATLFFCLTGVCPFPAHGSLTQQAASRLVHQPLRLRLHRPEVSSELETVIGRMMAHAREDRYPTPQSLLRALLPFVRATQEAWPQRLARLSAAPRHAEENQAGPGPAPPRILIVDDEPDIRRLCKSHFQRAGFQCTEASDGAEALALLAKTEFDLVLLDIDMPHMSGSETLIRVRQELSCGRLKVIMISGGVSPDEMSAMLALRRGRLPGQAADAVATSIAGQGGAGAQGGSGPLRPVESAALPGQRRFGTGAGGAARRFEPHSQDADLRLGQDRRIAHAGDGRAPDADGGVSAPRWPGGRIAWNGSGLPPSRRPTMRSCKSWKRAPRCTTSATWRCRTIFCTAPARSRLKIAW